MQQKLVAGQYRSPGPHCRFSRLRDSMSVLPRRPRQKGDMSVRARYPESLETSGEPRPAPGYALAVAHKAPRKAKRALAEWKAFILDGGYEDLTAGRRRQHAEQHGGRFQGESNGSYGCAVGFISPPSSGLPPSS